MRRASLPTEAADIEADRVGQFDRAHRHAELLRRLVEHRPRHAFLVQAHRFEQVGHQDAVDEESRRALDRHRQLVDRLAECERAFFVGRIELILAHDLDQRHLRDRIEVVQAEEARRARRRPCAIRRAECSRCSSRAARRPSSPARSSGTAPAWLRDSRRSPRSRDRQSAMPLPSTSALSLAATGAMRSGVLSRFANRSCARSSAGWMNFISRSCRVTSKPRNAHHAAMSPPMTPAPTTCTCAMPASPPPSPLQAFLQEEHADQVRGRRRLREFRHRACFELQALRDARSAATPDFDQRERGGILILAHLGRGLLAHDRREDLADRPDVRRPRLGALRERTRARMFDQFLRRLDEQLGRRERIDEAERLGRLGRQRRVRSA